MSGSNPDLWKGSYDVEIKDKKGTVSVHRDNNLLLNTFVTKGAVFNYQWEVCGGESQTSGFWEFTSRRI